MIGTVSALPRPHHAADMPEQDIKSFFHLSALSHALINNSGESAKDRHSYLEISKKNGDKAQYSADFDIVAMLTETVN